MGRIGKKQQDIVAAWISNEGRRLAEAAAFFDGLNAALARVGVVHHRAMFSLLTLHPQARASGFEWHDDRPTVEVLRSLNIQFTNQYLLSPIKRIHDGADEVRAPLVGPRAARDLPIYDEFRADGYTDYVVFAVPFGDGTRNALSMSTRSPRGFREEELALVRAVIPLIAMVFEIHSGRRIAGAVLDTYVGKLAAQRILKGEIHRGQGEKLNAVIWFADLRGFTALSDLRPTHEVIAALNEFFDALGNALEPRGGQILKFMGDGLLAIFPIDDAAFQHYAARQALEAGLAAHAEVDRINVRRAAAGAPVLRFNVALHVGVVIYGNIGSATRLDFTCIGPAVNLAVRIEGLGARLGAPVVMSKAFANLARENRVVVSLGQHPVKGLMAAPEIFTLAEFAPARAVAAE